MKQVEKVVLHHLSAFQAGDMEAVMSDYTEQSILIKPDGILTGKKAIEAFLRELSKLFPPKESEINLEQFIVTDALAYIIWNAQTPLVSIKQASDTFIIENGKIVKQTFVGELEALGK